MDASYVDVYAELEEKHWWWRARRSILVSILAPLLYSESRVRILEIGCASGANLSPFSEHCDVVGIEPDDAFVNLARARNRIEVHQGSLPDGLPTDLGTFDIVLALDVLEHVQEDAAACAAIRKLLRPGGHFLVTVPANPWMWSEFDELNNHYRRYTKAQVKELLVDSGFALELISYFNFFFFGPIAAGRTLTPLFLKRGSKNRIVPRIPPRFLNEICEWIFALERHWLNSFTFPIGGSLISLAQRDMYT